MSTDNCVHCGSREVEHGNGWRSLTCVGCATILKEDFAWNQSRIKAYHRKEITIEELRAGYRNRLKEIYYSTTTETAAPKEEPPKGQAGGEGA